MIKPKKETDQWLLEKGITDKAAQDMVPFLRTDRKGVTFQEDEYAVTNRALKGYTTALCEIMLKGGNTCIVKNKIGDVLGSINEQGKTISVYNNIILPYLGESFFGIDTVKYYIARFTDPNNKLMLDSENQYLITLDAKQDEEEIIEGWQMIKQIGMNELEESFTYRMFATEEYLRIQNVFEHQIQQTTDELIRQEIFKKFIRYVDNQNTNWSIAIHGRNARAFPAYDFDLCCNADLAYEIESKTDNGKTDLTSFIMQFQDLPWMKKYLENIIEHFEMEQLFQISSKSTNIHIPNGVKSYYTEFFKQRMAELKQAYKKFNKVREDDER